MAEEKKVERKPGQEIITGPSLAQQHMKEAADINNIASRFMKTGVLSSGMEGGRTPLFGDFTSIDFHAMRNHIADIEQGFESLPSRIRARFRNDPYQLLRFLEDPKNEVEARKMGLLKPEVPKETVQVDLVKESEKGAVKADPEAQPQFKDGKKPDAK